MGRSLPMGLSTALQLHLSGSVWVRCSKLFKAVGGGGWEQVLKFGSVPLSQSKETLFGCVTSERNCHSSSTVLKATQRQKDILDFRNPHEWYPMSRSIKRRIVYHTGPTNSGKTHTALERLKSSDKGLYCAPLRLLAMEVFESLNKGGVYCNLVTGQERKMIPGARHTAATVEMIDLQTHYNVAVIDEIQLLGDKERAFAWTRALHGLAANELHLCGDPSVRFLVQNICEDMKEPLEVHKYNRLTPLKMDSDHIDSYEDVRPGDCIVAFSRTDIYEIKQMIEYRTEYKVAVVYGALPPEIRRQQAALFNEQGNGYDVLVASDAVGMGLNLNIRRIVFHTLNKFDGANMVPLLTSQIKQISGRAGRRSSVYPVGKVTCLSPDDLVAARAALKLSPKQMRTNRAGIFPESEHIARIAEHFKTHDLRFLAKKIDKQARLDERYFLCKSSELLEIADSINELPLSFEDRLSFCFAPVDTRDPNAMSALREYATIYSKGFPVRCRVAIPAAPPLFLHQLKQLEISYQIGSLWMWLSYRLGQDRFPSRSTTEKQLHEINRLFRIGLQQITILPRSNEQDDVLAASLPKRTRNAKPLVPFDSISAEDAI